MPASGINGPSYEPVERSTKDPIFQPQRRLKVAVIGAGASGLLLAYKLQRHFDNLDLKVYEKNPAVSGVWFESVGHLVFRSDKREGVACSCSVDISGMCM